MSHFVQHLLSRHAQPDYAVQPRVRSRFEPPSLTDTGLGIADEPAEDVPAAANSLKQQPDQPVNLPPVQSTKPTVAQGVVSTDNVPDSGESEPIRKLADSPANVPDRFVSERRGEPTTTTVSAKTDNVPAQETTSPNRAATVQPAANFSRQPSEPTRLSIVVPAIPETKSSEPDSWESPQPVRFGRSVGIFSENGAGRSAATQPIGTSLSPTVQVTIGRIEVRAILPTTPAKAATVPSTGPKPRLSLEEYLKQRDRAS